MIVPHNNPSDNGTWRCREVVSTSAGRPPAAGARPARIETGWCVRLMVFSAICIAIPAKADVLPSGEAPEAIPAPHFPDRLHTFIWRNWPVVEADRMAEVLGTSVENIRRSALSMGLPPEQAISDLQKRRGYISVIRRNWHLLPYDQLLTLLGWDADRLAYTLKEDDFLWHKLGALKPKCPPLCYALPDEAAQKRCAEIKTLVQKYFAEELNQAMEPRFAFVGDLSKPMRVPNPPVAEDDKSIRFLYSYFAVYGDPLLDPELDPYPDGLLQRLAACGVNGVWLHTVLRQLAPAKEFPEFGQGHETRLANLRRLVNRAKQYGINVYLYMNEPRCMPPEFFKNHPDIAGIKSAGHIAMCSSNQKVRQWMKESLAYVFREVPELGGVFTITASENLTNCWSRLVTPDCPRCAQRKAAEVIAEVNRAIAEGVWAGNPRARVIVWDWVWQDDWAENIIRQLPKEVYLMSVSEWSLPIERGGVSTAVGEYSISAVGPGPRAERHWAWAKQYGLKTMAKVQVNCTWEISAVPYVPAMNLVGRHLDNLRRSGIDGMMLSWTLGGYPSPNLELVRQFSSRPEPTFQEALSRVAVDRFGPNLAADVLEAWDSFSRAYAEFPYHISGLYSGPYQLGPANLLYAQPTGYKATMVGFPYDHLESWRGPYPPEVYVGQFEKVAQGWRTGLDRLRQALDKPAESAHRKCLADDLRIAEAAWLHFQSTVKQARFILARNALGAKSLKPAERAEYLDTMRTMVRDEIELARRMFTLTRLDARIGYEATNHYYYYPLDLIEKVINCEYVLAKLSAAQAQGSAQINGKPERLVNALVGR